MQRTVTMGWMETAKGMVGVMKHSLGDVAVEWRSLGKLYRKGEIVGVEGDVGCGTGGRVQGTAGDSSSRSAGPGRERLHVDGVRMGRRERG